MEWTPIDQGGFKVHVAGHGQVLYEEDEVPLGFHGFPVRGPLKVEDIVIQHLVALARLEVLEDHL